MKKAFVTFIMSFCYFTLCFGQKEEKTTFGIGLNNRTQVDTSFSHSFEATESIDFTGDFDSKDTDLDARIIVPSKVLTYAFPTYGEGVTRLDTDGNITDVFLNLFLNYDEEQGYTLKDVAYESNLGKNPENTTKKYTIGFCDMDNDIAAFSLENFKDGIDVNAYAGREITVTAFLHDNDDEELTRSSKQQTIFIPQLKTKKYGVFTEGNITYYQYPPAKIFKSDTKMPYFNEYMTSLNNGNSVVSIQTSIHKEQQSSSWDKIGLTVKNTSDKSRKNIFLGDDWLRDLGHPPAYPTKNDIPQNFWKFNDDGTFNLIASHQAWWDKWYADFVSANDNILQAREVIKQKFKSLTYQFSDYKLVFLNNELYPRWNTTFSSWVRDAMADYTKSYPESYVVGWTSAIFNFPFPAFSSNKEYPIGGNDTLKIRSYEDLTFNSNSNFDTYANWSERYFPLKPSSDIAYGAKMNQIGGYIGSLFHYSTIYNIITEALIYQRHGFNKRVVGSLWTEIEALSGSFNSTPNWLRFKNKTYRVWSKGIVPTDVMYSLGATYAFFLNSGTIDLWSYPINFNDTGDGVYPYETVFEELPDGSQKRVTVTTGNNYVPTHTLTTINSLVDGIWAVNQNKNIIENSFVEIADVFHNGTWQTNENAYPHGAKLGPHPLVAYRVHENKLLVYAYEYANHSIKMVRFRTADGREYEVELRGNIATIARINL